MKQKHAGFLKLIIIYKTLMGLSELVFSVYLYDYGDRNAASLATKLALALHIDVKGHVMSFIIAEAGRISENTVLGATMLIFLFSILNLIESAGLHMRMRWAEWMTVIGTAAMIPFEVYRLVARPRLMMLVLIIINAAIVYHLARHKELFSRRKTTSEFFEEI